MHPTSSSSASITQSPLLRLDILDKILQTPNLTATKKAQLISAKLHILTNNPTANPISSKTPKSPHKAHIEILHLRVILAETYLEIVPPKLVEAESELTIVENECKRALKFGVSERAKRSEQDIAEEQAGKDEEYEMYIKDLRVKGLKLLIDVEEGLGRTGRAKRWRDLLDSLGAGT